MEYLSLTRARLFFMKRHELTDEQWALVEPHLPRSTARTGRPASDRRTQLNGIFWILSTGAPWRDLPERFGPWQTVYGHFSAWRNTGVFAAIIEALQVKLDNQGYIDWELWCVDGSSVRAARAAAGADKKVSSGIPTNPPTTHWAAAEAGLARNSMWSLTVRAFPLPSKSRPDKSTNRRAPSRSSARRSQA
jgi:transposase